MKDQRFTELVNLYIDRQITEAETTELEAEIQASPRRRAVYQQYCKMHRATTLVYESFRAEAPAQQTAPTGAKGGIAQFQSERRTRGFRWTYYAGGLAAAACLGLVFLRLNSKPAIETNSVATVGAPAAPHVSVAAPEVRVATAATEPKAGLLSLRNNAAAEPDYIAQLASLRQEEQRSFANGQLQAGRPASLFEDGVFDSQQVIPAANQRTYRGKQTPAQAAEFTAFQFQR